MEIVDLLSYAIEYNASDLFVNANKVPSVRVLGKVKKLGDEAVSLDKLEAFREHVLDDNNKMLYAKNGSCDASVTLDEHHRFRLNFYSSYTGCGFVARPLRSGNDLSLADLGLPEVVNQLCEEPRGLILVAGTTGSGKSTTLGCMINHINRNFEKHIITIEDPIEYTYDDINSLVTQREINSGVHSFADALRAALRENPDVIVVGEMRDMDTMQTAINAALTGHLVISTMHTANTIQAIERIINVFPEETREQVSVDLGLALNGIFAQRLLCSTEGKMIPALEILLGTSPMKKLIANRDYPGMEMSLKSSGESGMVTFNRAIFRLYSDGIISMDEAENAVDNKEEFRLLTGGMESGADTFRNHYGDKRSTDDTKNIDMRRLLRTAVKMGASDMILSSGAAPNLRLDGELRALDLPPLQGADTQRLLYSILSQRQRVEFEEKREIDLALSVTMKNDDGTERSQRFRINGFFQRGTVGVVSRIVNSSIPTPEILTIPQQIVNFTKKAQGLILVTGPTGSGKSTTLASLINYVNRTRFAHIITIEDPIEYVHENVNSLIEQRELHSDTFGFATALKYALRQDPDIIMVGEMRDTETIGAALTAAETGHLVFGTLHTNSATQTIDRIIDTFPSHQQNQVKLQLASVLLAVISQRLLTRIDGKGGRAAAFEVLVGTPPAQALIREGKTSQLQSVLETGFRDGMVTLERSLDDLFSRGLISQDEMRSLLRDYNPTESFK